MITETDVNKVAILSKLKFSTEESKILTSELINIVKMIDELANLDCQNIEPLTSVLNSYQRLRDDEVTITDNSIQILSNAPGKQSALAKELKCFIVPKVID